MFFPSISTSPSTHTVAPQPIKPVKPDIIVNLMEINVNRFVADKKPDPKIDDTEFVQAERERGKLEGGRDLGGSGAGADRSRMSRLGFISEHTTRTTNTCYACAANPCEGKPLHLPMILYLSAPAGTIPEVSYSKTQTVACFRH